ncbi:MAG: divalent cation tolerance protein CutA [Butyrivibrio sp.]|nr:divalent cation tolerance protein CutA [Butyrivibrio sp.]
MTKEEFITQLTAQPVDNSYLKIEVLIPKLYEEIVLSELRKTGAGIRNNYETYTIIPVINHYNRFAGSEDCYGSKENEQVTRDEYMLTFQCHTSKLSAVMDAILRVHPYERPKINIIPIL